MGILFYVSDLLSQIKADTVYLYIISKLITANYNQHTSHIVYVRYVGRLNNPHLHDHHQLIPNVP